MKAAARFAVVTALVAGFSAGEVLAATEWNVSLWGKRRAGFTDLQVFGDFTGSPYDDQARRLVVVGWKK